MLTILLKVNGVLEVKGHTQVPSSTRAAVVLKDLCNGGKR